MIRQRHLPFPPFRIADEDGFYVTDRPVTAEEILDCARNILRRRFERAATFAAPDAARSYFATLLATREAEVFTVAFLDNRHRLIACEDMFFGTIDGASVHPREVVKAALRHNAAAVILAHNHPSGIPEPSCADQSPTRRLIVALALVDVGVLDHIVVGGAETVSFAERGML